MWNQKRLSECQSPHVCPRSLPMSNILAQVCCLEFVEDGPWVFSFYPHKNVIYVKSGGLEEETDVVELNKEECWLNKT